MKKKFGELLLDRGLITPEQLADALALQRRRGMRLGAALVARGHITEGQLVSALGAALNIRVIDLTTVRATPDALQLVSHRFALDHDLFPYQLRRERGRKVLSLAMADPLNYRVIDELSFVTDATIEPVLARSSDIEAAIRRYYGVRIAGTGSHDKIAPEAAAADEATMTILRKGGGEEVIDTTTGEVISPFIKGPDGSVLENPAVKLPREAKSTPPKRADEISAVLLTDEVAPSTPVDPVVSTGPVPIPLVNKRIPNVITAPMSSPPMPHSPAPAPGPLTSPYFDDALGALLDAAGGAVNAESFAGLERKFWALMRVLARKGILNNEEFLRELGEEDR